MINYTEFIQRHNTRAIEKPENGQDGDCIVHYKGEFSDCVMKVKLVNGKREGRATIWKGEKPFIYLEYKNGKVDGSIEVVDEYGEIELRGHLENGIEKGIFKEYGKSMIVWIGYYYEGKRFSVLQKSTRFDGLYEERRVDNGQLLSVAEYDSDMSGKNGYCIESEKGELTEWIYEKGVKEGTTGSDWSGFGTESRIKHDKPDEERESDSGKRIRLDTSVKDWDNDKSLIAPIIPTLLNHQVCIM